MANYQEARFQLTNTHLSKLRSEARNKTGTILRINKKNFQDEGLPHELFLTTRQATEKRSEFADNMSTDIKLSKAQISKIIQSGGSFGSWLGNLSKKALANAAIPLARDTLPELVRNLASNAGKGFNLLIWNEHMNDIIKINKSLEDSNILIDKVTETVKHDIKNKKADFFLLC